MAISALKNLAKLVKNVSDNKPIAETFLMELHRTIENTDVRRQPSATYKPSSLGGCMRNMYFQITGADGDEENRTYTNIGITESGTDRHERLQAAITQMQKQGFECEWISVKEFIRRRKPVGTKVVAVTGHESKCFNSVLNMSFMCDGIVKYRGKYYIIEIKTESLYKWQGQTQAMEEHITQAAAYSVCLGINLVLFIYENRDNCDKKAFVVEITVDMRDGLVVNKIETCNSYLLQNLTPPKSDNKKDCTYCSYKTECEKW